MEARWLLHLESNSSLRAAQHPIHFPSELPAAVVQTIERQDLAEKQNGIGMLYFTNETNDGLSPR